ncbi:MAG TPA: DoxX family protein [Gemmatimonadaceae bacterium]|nr:DoxX family protein [Gemmatimonadaceae bacterium]
MSVTTDVAAPSKGQMWTGRVLSGLVVLFLLFDATIHILKPEPVVTAFGQLGYPLAASVPIGIIELVCVALYLIPSTSILGAILLTGYLGGAIAAQLRIGAPLFSTMLFPVYVALFVWGGLYLRDPIVRTLIPARR